MVNTIIKSTRESQYHIIHGAGMAPQSVDLFMEDRARVSVTTLDPLQKVETICHIHASKQITVLDGYAEVEMPEACLKLFEGQTAYIPSGTAHEIVNSGKIPLKYVEIRTGPYVLDDDQLS